MTLYTHIHICDTFNQSQLKIYEVYKMLKTWGEDKNEVLVQWSFTLITVSLLNCVLLDCIITIIIIIIIIIIFHILNIMFPSFIDYFTQWKSSKGATAHS